jgi:hypothetical protein
LQSPTTGSLEAMIRETDREDQLAEFRKQQKNATAGAALPPSSPSVFPTSPSTGVTTGVASAARVEPARPTPAAGENAATVALNITVDPPAPAVSQPVAKVQTPAEEMPAYVPAPKSLVSSTGLTELAAVNPNSTSEARATLTSLSAKPIDAAINPISPPGSPKGHSAQLGLGPTDQNMRIGETRRFALDLKSDLPLMLAIVALRFDPKIVKVRAVGVDGSSVSFTQSTDASGVCLISVSNLGGMTGPGTLIYIDVEGVGLGDAGLLLDQRSSHLVATDARDLGVEVTPVRATVKQ